MPLISCESEKLKIFSFKTMKKINRFHIFRSKDLSKPISYAVDILYFGYMERND
jgi:hypothetical protein